jgi:hypothetical protein
MLVNHFALPTNANKSSINGNENDMTSVILFNLGCTDMVEMTIDTGSHGPIRLKPHRAPLNQRKIIDKTMEELLTANIIRKSRPN